VLQHICSLIVRQARPTDTVIRYGGEEFVVIAPFSDLAMTSLIGQSMLLRMAEEPVPLPNGGQLRVTASIGVSSLLADDSASQLLHRADEALYLAKRSGRNRLCIADNARMSPAA